MTYHHIRTPAQHLTPGADEPRANCDGRPEVFDALIEREHGRAPQYLIDAAWALCGPCPLRPTCHAAHHDEPWVAAMEGRPVRVRPVARGEVSDETRRKIAETNRKRIAAKNAARLAELTALIDQGADLYDVLAAFGVKRNTLWSWCKTNGHADLYAQITPGRGRQKREAAA